MNEPRKKKYVYYCKKDGCDRRTYKKGLCYRHYKEIGGDCSVGKKTPVGSDDWKERIKKVIYILEQIPMEVDAERRAELVIETYEYLYEK